MKIYKLIVNNKSIILDTKIAHVYSETVNFYLLTGLEALQSAIKSWEEALTKIDDMSDEDIVSTATLY